jgi:hypothetical protein
MTVNRLVRRDQWYVISLKLVQWHKMVGWDWGEWVNG